MTADLVVLTVLPEEYAAVLSCLGAPELLPGTATTPNLYAWRLGTIDAPRYGAPFQVVVGKGTQTPTFGALAAKEAIDLFHSPYIAFVGVAGGFDLDRQRHGDVAVSSLVVAYEYGKVDSGGFAPRGDFTYRCSEALVRASDALAATGESWWRDDDNPAGRPTVRAGMIASGDKVIDDPDDAFFAAVRARWPKLLAVEMEGAGVAAAVHEVNAHRAVGFVLVRGISDMPHQKTPGAPPSTAERDRWKATASRNAARFLAHLVAHAWPIPPRNTPRAVAPDLATEVVDEPATRAQSVPLYPSPEIAALSKRHENALARKHRLADAGLATHDVDREIHALRRELRDGGQLRAGDSLDDGRYLLIRPLGRGGFAVVWEALDRSKQRRVAIKVLHPHLAGDPQRRERFFRGARVMMTLAHAAVVRVHEPRGQDDSFCYFVMELVPGGNLRDAVLGKRVESERRLAVIMQVGEALAEAHRRQLIHRDIKPQNILLDETGAAKLTDFDLVGAHDTTGGTRTGALGTVVYAAPECLDRPQQATARADVFGLGMTAIFCLSGRDLSMATFRNPEAAVARLDCSAPVARVLARAVNWEPEERFADAGAMLDALGDAIEPTSEMVTPEDRTRTRRAGPPRRLAHDIPRAASNLAVTTAVYPRRFGNYTLLSCLTQGDLGAMHLAIGEDRDLERLMAIKTLRRHVDKEQTARFRHESDVALALSHANLLPVHATGRVEDELFLAMDFVEGRDLRAAWNCCAKKQVAFPIDVAAYIVKELCRGLAYAHSFADLHVVHRDVSPPNILLSSRGEVKLTDFGLAASRLTVDKTAPGIIYGKVAYLSPEQARGDVLDGRSDMYAAAIVLWELLTGRQLFPPSKNQVQDLLARGNHPGPMPPSKRAPRVPAELDEICMKALSPSKDDRYPDCDAMSLALQQWLERNAPATDATHIAAFAWKLFAEDLERERAERADLLRALG